MKNLGKLAVLGAVLAASSSFAFADSITLSSFATGGAPATYGDSASETAMAYTGFVSFAAPPADPQPFEAPSSTFSNSSWALAPAGVWNAALANSQWVGEASTAGPGGTNPAYGYYTFSSSFTATGGNYGGTISVQADDTTEVFLDGTLIIPFGNLGNNNHCADNAPTCSSLDVVNVSGIALAAGANANKITFVVEQAGNEAPGLDPSGIDFGASLTLQPAPEPSSLLLLGTGLLGAAGMLFRRRLIA